MTFDLSTLISDTDVELDATLEHAGALWTFARFGGTSIMVSEQFGDRWVSLDADQQANAEVVTLLDVIETAIEEARAEPDIWGLCVALFGGAVLLAARASLGPIVTSDGVGFACLIGPMGEPERPMAYSRRAEFDADDQIEIVDEYTHDLSAFAAARVFLERATRRGARLAVERFKERHGLPAAAPTPVS